MTTKHKKNLRSRLPFSTGSFKRPKFWRQHRWVRITSYVLGAIIVFSVASPLFNPLIFPPVKTYNFGVSFSPRRSAEMGLDWRANYLALLDDLQIREFRLMSYWDEHEKQRGQFNFSDLDWQMNEAAKRGAKVSLSIGLRQPRWPECHQPGWTTNLAGNDWKQALYAYIEVVVKRYENHPALRSWQLENEGMNTWFGTCLMPDRERLVEEYDLVDRLSQKPIWMSLSDQHGLPLGDPKPDEWGFSVYRIVWNNKTGPLQFYMYYPTPVWYHKLRKTLIKVMTGREIFIHELQLEPWGPRDTIHLSLEEQDKSMSLTQMRRNLNFARMIGAADIYTWGSEWWYWRKVKFNDNSVWETVKEEIKESRGAPQTQPKPLTLEEIW